jgi:hypothetical protein
MNAIAPQGQFGAPSQLFANQPVENELGAGVHGGFGMIGYKGKVWSIRKGGDEKPLMREDGDGPRASIEVVVVKAPTVISKIFYENGYVEGSTASPDCYSTNGLAPAPGAAKKQCATCAACPKNAWGSRITPQGKQGKACSDSKRLAVVPLGDLKNEMFGGPMLLRVPAASLQDMSSFGQKMASLGYPAGSYGMRVAFDVNEAYPKFVFTAIRPLNDVEAKVVIDWRNGPEVARILAEDEHSAAPAQIAAPAQQSVFEQPNSTGGAPLLSQQQTTTATPLPVQPTSHMTGVASSTPAQPAAATGNTVTPTPAAPATPAQPSGGVTKPTPSSQMNSDGTAQSATPVSGTAENAPTGLANFDAALDALLA